jgi:hypothetical protein
LYKDIVLPGVGRTGGKNYAAANGSMPLAAAGKKAEFLPQVDERVVWCMIITVAAPAIP